MPSLSPIPPSTGATTVVDDDVASSLCSSQQPPHIMTGVFTRLMREHFARAENLLYNQTSEKSPQLEQYIWTEDAKTTKIQIQPVWDYNVQDIQRRPALYIKRNAWQTQRMAINDGMTVNAQAGPDGKVLRVRGEYHSRFVMGSHTVFCVAASAGAVELLGTEIFDFLVSFAPLLRKDLEMHRFEVQEVGAISVLQESTDHFVLPVVTAYAFAHTWRLEAVAPWLKSMAIDLRAVRC